MLLETGAAHWEVLLRARAIECQCYVIAAAQAGLHNSKRESYGHALIIDPWGVVVAQLHDPSETGSRGAAVGQDEDYILCFIGSWPKCHIMDKFASASVMCLSVCITCTPLSCFLGCGWCCSLGHQQVGVVWVLPCRHSSD